jgi:hypothetical protein
MIEFCRQRDGIDIMASTKRSEEPLDASLRAERRGLGNEGGHRKDAKSFAHGGETSFSVYLEDQSVTSWRRHQRRSTYGAHIRDQ